MAATSDQDAIIELTENFLRELQKEVGRPLSEEEVYKTPKRTIDKVFLRAYSPNPDGSTASVPKVIESLKAKYGSRISDEYCEQIGKRYQQAIFNTKTEEAMSETLMLAMHPETRDTALGKAARKIIKPLIEKSME